MGDKINLSGMWWRFNHSPYPIWVNRFTQTNSTHEHAPHFHDYPQVFFLLKGSYRHVIGGTEYHGEAGSMMIIPPGITHDYVIDDGEVCEFVMVCVMPSFFDMPEEQNQLHTITHMFFPEFSKELGFEPCLCRTLFGNELKYAEYIFSRLGSYNWLRSVNNISLLRREFCNLFLHNSFLLSEHTLKKSLLFYKNKFLPIIKTVYYMNINYNKIIHRNELISMSNICQTDYFRLIKRIIGCTYSTYMQLIRVRRAIELCTFSTYSLSYIADICGFGDLAYMEKRIKKFHPTSILPSVMKKNRSKHIKSWPFAVKSRSEYENVCKHFYSYGL